MPEQPIICDNYLSKESKATGIAQVVIGVLCNILNFIAVFDKLNGLGSVCLGIWCGILFLVTGLFGIGASNTKRKCEITTYMVLSIICACFTAPLFAYGIAGAVFGSIISLTTYSLLAVAAIVEAIFAIYGAMICCKSRPGCCGNPYSLTVIIDDNVPSNGQMISTNQTQTEPCINLQQLLMDYPSDPLPQPPPFVPSDTESGYFLPPPSYHSINRYRLARTEPPPKYDAEFSENS